MNVANKEQLKGLRPDWPTITAFAVPLLVYLRTLCPTVYTYDSAEIATGVFSLGIVHATGYPLYLLLGKLFTIILPVGSVAYELNLMSAVFAALAVAVAYRVALALTKQPILSLAAILLFAFSFYFWQSAVVAEVYTLQSFLTACLLLIAVRWGTTGSSVLLHLLALVFGLSLGNHMSGILVAPGLAYFLLATGARRVLAPRTLLLVVVFFLVGLLVYLYLPWRYSSDSAINYVRDYYKVDLTSPGGILWMISGQMYKFYMFGYRPEQLPSELGQYVSWLSRSFAGIGIVVGMAGVARCFQVHRRVCGLLGLVFGANMLFFLNYAVVDKDTMFLPSYLIWAFWIAEGYSAIIGWLSRVGLGVAPAMRTILRAAASGTAVLVSLLALVFNMPAVDQSNNWDSEVFADRVFAEVEPNAVVLGNWHSAVVLEYFQVVEGRRKDLTILNRSRLSVAWFYDSWARGVEPERALLDIVSREVEMLGEMGRQRPLYAIGHDQTLAQYFEFLPVGDYYKLQERARTGDQQGFNHNLSSRCRTNRESTTPPLRSTCRAFCVTHCCENGSVEGLTKRLTACSIVLCYPSSASDGVARAGG